MSATQKATSINLAEAKVVLVRFYFSNPHMVPSGMRRVQRKSEAERLQRLREAAPATDVRGYEALDNIQMAQVAVLRRGLANNGLRLSDVHMFESRKLGRATKHVVNLAFRQLDEDEEPFEISLEIAEGIRELATNAVWTAHGWWNPNGVMVIDLVQRQPGVVPRHAIVVRNGRIVSLPTNRRLEEIEENAEIAADILKTLESF